MRNIKQDHCTSYPAKAVPVGKDGVEELSKHLHSDLSTRFQKPRLRSGQQALQNEEVPSHEFLSLIKYESKSCIKLKQANSSDYDNLFKNLTVKESSFLNQVKCDENARRLLSISNSMEVGDRMYKKVFLGPSYQSGRSAKVHLISLT